MSYSISTYICLFANHTKWVYQQDDSGKDEYDVLLAHKWMHSNDVYYVRGVHIYINMSAIDWVLYRKIGVDLI